MFSKLSKKKVLVNNLQEKTNSKDLYCSQNFKITTAKERCRQDWILGMLIGAATGDCVTILTCAEPVEVFLPTLAFSMSLGAVVGGVAMFSGCFINYLYQKNKNKKLNNSSLEQ